MHQMKYVSYRMFPLVGSPDIGMSPIERVGDASTLLLIKNLTHSILWAVQELNLLQGPTRHTFLYL